MIFDYLDVFGKIRAKQLIFADDAVDKLNRSFTLILAISMAIFIGIKNFGDTINCVEEAVTHSKIDIKYVNSLCFAKDMYTLKQITDKNSPSVQITSIYPWLPFIAVLMGAMFYLPYLIWKNFLKQNSYQHVEVDISNVIDFLKQNPNFKKNDFYQNIDMVSDYLDTCFSLNNYHDGFFDEVNMRFITNREPKKYRDRRRRRIQFYIPLIVKYIFVKFLYLSISIFLFFFSSELLQVESGTSFYKFVQHLFGTYLNPAKSVDDYLDSRYFPRLIFCDVHIRQDFGNNVNKYQYQCSLPANVFNEKAFAILWAWFFVLIIINTFSLFSWIVRTILRSQIIMNMVLWPFAYNHQVEKHIPSFVSEYLSTEGYLIMMLIKSNTNDWCCRAILRKLWEKHLTRVEAETMHNNQHPSMYNQYHLEFEPNQMATEINEKNLMKFSPQTAETEKVYNRREINFETTQDGEQLLATPAIKQTKLRLNDKEIPMKNI